MDKIIKPIGHGLLAAAIVLIVIYFVGVYLKGTDALRDALDPFALRNYLAIAPLVPGVLLLWLSDYTATRRRGYDNRSDLPATGTD